jgi:short-subunit dehydrogenase
MTMNGKTALITGASSGIGAAIAIRLAAEGAGLVLVARSEDKLQALATLIGSQHGRRPTVIAADLSRPDCATTLESQVQAKGLEVDILVNNAGFGTYGAFEALPAAGDQEQIAVNIAAVVALSHAFLPGMLARGHGAILNTASTAAFQPAPYMAVYAATKAFVLSFSEALWAEYRHRGIQVAALCPGAVDTGFIDRLGSASVRQTAVFASTLDAQTVAQHAVKALNSRAPTHIVGLKNWLMAQSVRFSPRSMVSLMGAAMLRPPAAAPQPRPR